VKRRLVLLILLGGLLALGTAALGQASTGDPALYVERVDAGGRSGEVLFVRADGSLAAVPVPAALYPAGYPGTTGLSDLALSADGTKLAAAFYTMDESSTPPVVIADLTLGRCCTVLAAPLPRIYAWDLAGFSPDGSQFALSYVGEGDTGGVPYAGGMAIYDVATGAIAQMTGMDAPTAALGDVGLATWAQMGGWTDNGIQWTPSCYACEPPLEGEYSLWAPQKNSFIPRSGVFFTLFGDFLAGTGELLYASQVAGFPISPEMGMLPIPNVIQYVPGGVAAPFDALAAAPVVFFDGAALNLGEGAHWVANGSAFLVTPPDWPSWTLRDRSGAQQPIAAAPGARFVAGTADGWLAAVPNGGQIELVRYVVSPVGAFGAVIDRAQPRDDWFSAYHPLYTPPLGAGITPIAPPEVAPSLTAATPAIAPLVITGEAPGQVQCAGFLPSRLMINQPARVTPGAPNNLRALPNVTAELVGRMPGGSEFMVLQGPVCDAAGLAWWQVSYEGLIGWTVEGQGSEYYTEPLLPAG
jgi:hypothetical protein